LNHHLVWKAFLILMLKIIRVGDTFSDIVTYLTLINFKDNTALHLAAMSPSERCEKIILVLLENGADPNKSNWFGELYAK